MRGRQPTPTATLKLRGSWRAKTRKGEPAPKSGVPSPPAILDAEAGREWKRVLPQLKHMGLLTTADRAEFALYCQAWSDWCTAVKAIRQDGAVFTTPKGYVAKNPWVTIANEAWKRCHDAAQQFGFTPASRSRINVGDSRVNASTGLAGLFNDVG